MRIRRYATMWDCEIAPADFERASKNSAYVWERLDTAAPSSALPYCCYTDTVIFYEDRLGGKELGRAHHYDFIRVATALVFVQGEWWEVGGGSVIWRDHDWHFRHHVRRNTRAAIEAQLGHVAHRRRELSGRHGASHA